MRAGSASHPASKPASSASAASRPASAPSTQPTSGTLSVAVFEPTRPRLRGVLVAYRGARGAAKEATRTKDQALARAQQVERLARQPDSDFALLAKRYSDDPSADVGGLLPPGIVNESKAAEEAFAALQPGQVSHPVETPSGYFVFQRVASFDDMPDGQKMPDQISVRNLLISYCGARGALPGIRRTHDEAKELAVELRTRALDPTVDFQELVLNYSDDPSAVSGGLNDLMRENVSSTFVDLLFRLQPGEVSSVIESPMGFHIFKREK
ncbi:MAG: peptidylprolyl isomerase [Candidatus Sumerlaeota bacterium]|nr:peptidylprolyl isomerase [Candidatus Sumerlaeota bacterium]